MVIDNHPMAHMSSTQSDLYTNEHNIKRDVSFSVFHALKRWGIWPLESLVGQGVLIIVFS